MSYMQNKVYVEKSGNYYISYGKHITNKAQSCAIANG